MICKRLEKEKLGWSLNQLFHKEDLLELLLI